MSKEKWKIMAASSGDMNSVMRIIDGNPATGWSFGDDNHKLPQEVSIDMGKLIRIKGFSYVPQQVGNNLDLISKYEFYTSVDNTKWIKQSEGEFSNIKNNPIEQIKLFSTVKARYIKFVAKAGIGKGNSVTICEINVIE